VLRLPALPPEAIDSELSQELAYVFAEFGWCWCT
jgi:hypothetical protein